MGRTREEKLFIVDNSDSAWNVKKYLAEWCELSKKFDIATGYFEIGSLLCLDEKWQNLDKIRILMGDYIYAVLYSLTYSKRYKEFLKIDFPRVPLTSDRDLFKTLCVLGDELVSQHLMKSQELANLVTGFKGEGDNIVAAIGKNSYKNGKLSINKTQYFEGIPEEVYNFYIGGYQVCQKWLKDCKGRELTEEDIEHYQKIVVTLNETIRVMREIDEVIEGHGEWPVQDIEF